MSAAQKLLMDYLAAFTSKQIESIENLCGTRTVFEIPFVKPARLIGQAEIMKAHREIFANLESIRFELDNCTANTIHAIAVGRFEVVRTGTERQHFQAGIVTEIDAGDSQRISLYCDARNVRPWSDRTIL